MKVKVSRQWFRENVIRNETGEIRELREHWYKVLDDHDFIGEFQFEVRDTEGKLLGARIGFFDDRLYYKRLYVTATPGHYEYITT